LKLTELQYINAESSGGGFPGWLQRIKGQLRTRAPDYLNATNNYMANVGATIAKAQITNGGPVILVQPENEYTSSSGNVTGGFPDRKSSISPPYTSYFAYLASFSLPRYVLGVVDGSQDIVSTPNFTL
jgi:hypothetical protein